MEVLLIRHGEASWDAKSDMERQLTSRGEVQVAAARDWLAAQGWQPDQLWVSPYRRAQQSADIVSANWNVRRRSIASLSPDSSLNELETLLETFSGERLLLVGHNPLLSNAIGQWHQGAPASYWGLQPASMALLHAEVLAPGTAALQWLRHFPNYDHNGR